jgi:nickel-dependent lactate racemase
MSANSSWHFPWGESRLDLTPPLSMTPRHESFAPDTSDAYTNESAYTERLESELDFPRNQPKLETRIGPGVRVAIVVDDPSRWTPLRRCLPVLLRRLAAAGVESRDISVCFGVGRHAAVTRDDMVRKLGLETVERYACHSPPVDDFSQYVDLGVSADGIPVRVFRPVVQADLRILVGSVLPHLQAGFGGGWKLIFPGCSHRSTLGAIHQQGLSGDAARLLGADPATNPMRQAISRAARLLPGGTLSVSHVIGRSPEEIYEVAAGDPDEVEARLAAEAKRRFAYVPPVGQNPADCILVGNAPWPGDPLHSFKVLLNHRAACKPGGVLAGVFWTDPAELGRSFSPGLARMISRTGPIGALATRIGLPAAEMFAALTDSPKRFMMRWARELVLDRHVVVYSPEMKASFGRRLGPVVIAGTPDEFWQAIRKRVGSSPAVTSFPWGGLSYAPVV